MASLLEQVKKNMQRLQSRIKPAASAAFQEAIAPPRQVASVIGNTYNKVKTSVGNELRREGQDIQRIDTQLGKGSFTGIAQTPLLHSAAASNMLPRPIQNFANKPFQLPQTNNPLAVYNPLYHLNKPIVEGTVNMARGMLFGDVQNNQIVNQALNKISKGQTPSSTEKEAVKRLTNMNNLNIIGTFGGSHAKGFDKAGGKFSSTLDKRVKFEISDRQASLKNFAKIKEGVVTTAEKVLDHKGLFKRYPAFKQIPVKFEKVRGGNGYFNPSKNEIVIDPRLTRKEMRSSILHEVQHVIQRSEGFATGTNLKTAGGMKNYLNSAGEIEARAVQAREGMSPELRRTVDPYASTMALDNIQKKDVRYRTNINSLIDAQDAGGIQGIRQTPPTQQPLSQPKAGVEGQSLDASVAQDPVQKIISALQEAKPIRGKQEAVYSKVRSQQAARLAGVGERVAGEKGYFAQLGQLKGEMPKVSFEGIRSQIKQPEIDSLFDTVEKNNILSPFEKVTAKTGLAKLLGAEGGVVPTKGELKLLNEIFPPELTQAILDKRPLMEKLFSGAVNALNIPRSLMATADLSAPLRQGIFLVGRPKQWAPAFKEMFKYAFDERAYKGLMTDIQARPTYKLMRQNKLALTDIGNQLSTREEAFMSTLPEKIPGLGSVVKGSTRAYTGFLNKLRADTFDDMYRSARQAGLVNENPKLVSDIANFVNTATGRGGLGKFERAAEILNGTLFAPRLVASRVQLLNPQYYVSLDPFVRKEALKSMLSFVGLGATVLGAASLGGAEVGTDPRNSDFGKIKVGNTRYDIWGGFQQYVKLAAQLYTGEIVSSTTGKTMTLGEGYNAMTRKDILLRFFESKESPVASFITSLVQGQTATGEPINLPAEVISRFIPLLAQDMYDQYQERGVAGIGTALPGMFGVGSQTYGKTEYVEGVNQIGQPTSQIRPTQGLPEKIASSVFGEKPLGSTKSFNAETYYNQLQKLPREEASAQFDQIAKTNPEVAKRIVKIVKDREKGITIKDEQLKTKGVASGDRAVEVYKEFKKLKSNEEKAKLWEDYVRKGVITKEVAEQLAKLLSSEANVRK